MAAQAAPPSAAASRMNATIAGSLLMALFYIGGELAQSRLGLPSALTGVYQGLLLFFLLMCDTFIAYRLQWRRATRVGAGA